MSELDVEELRFRFPEGWIAHKYDDWSFYRNQFSRMRGGIKAVDLVAVDPERTAWFIEVKDYRQHPRTKPTFIGDELAEKVFDTLAALLPAKVNANDATEQKVAESILSAKRLRIVLHLEQPKQTSALRPRAINPADLALKLRTLLKPIDAHPVIAEMRDMKSLAWTVE